MKKRMGRPPIEEPKQKYNLYFRPSFMDGLKALAESEGLSTSQLIEKKFKRTIERSSKK